MHVFFEFWRKYLIIISSSSSDAHKIILEDTQRIALRVEACTVPAKELYMLGLACGQIQPIMHFPSKQRALSKEDSAHINN